MAHTMKDFGTGEEPIGRLDAFYEDARIAGRIAYYLGKGVFNGITRPLRWGYDLAFPNVREANEAKRIERYRRRKAQEVFPAWTDNEIEDY